MNLQFSNYGNKRHPIMCDWQDKIKGMKTSGRERSGAKDKARKYKYTVCETYSRGPLLTEFPTQPEARGDNTICSKLITKYWRWVEYRPRFTEAKPRTRHALTHVGSPPAANFLPTLQPGAPQRPNLASFKN